MADDIGYGDPGCYNKDSKIPTPHIDQLASQGVIFTDAHSPSALCSPSRYGLLTGRYAWRTRLQKGVLLPYDPPLVEPGRMTLASMLKTAGYSTAWIGKWHMGLEWATKDGAPAENAIDREALYNLKTDEKRQWNIDFSQPIEGGPTQLGFDYFYGTAGCCTSDPPYCFIENDHTVVVPTQMSREEWRGLPGFLPGPMADDWSQEDCDFTLTRKAQDFIDLQVEQKPGRPFFLVLALSSPHNPWLVPADNRGKSKEGPRGDLVTVVDGAVGHITDHLEKNGLTGETLLIVTSDHGAMRGAAGHQSAGDFRGNKASAWEGGHRIPFVVRWPGMIQPRTTSSYTISLIDLLATFAKITGSPLPVDAAEDSRDVLAGLLGQADKRPSDEALIFDSGLGDFAVRQGRWKVMIGARAGPPNTVVGEIAAAGAHLLYDLAADPAETTDLSNQHPEIIRSMIGLLDDYRSRGRSRAK